jgi:hypothetical protein
MFPSGQCFGVGAVRTCIILFLVDYSQLAGFLHYQAHFCYQIEMQFRGPLHNWCLRLSFFAHLEVDTFEGRRDPSHLEFRGPVSEKKLDYLINDQQAHKASLL